MVASGTRTRTRGVPRLTPQSVHTGVWNRKVGGQWVPWNPPSPQFVNTSIPYFKREAVMDEVHDWPRVKEGGPFKSVKLLLPSTVPVGVGTYDTGTTIFNGFVQQYVGGFIPSWPWSGDSLTVQNYSSNLLTTTFLPDLSTYYPLVYKRLRPKLSSADAAVFLAELRDLPGMLRTTSKGFHQLWKSIVGDRSVVKGFSPQRLRRISNNAKMAPKEAADHYLNVQFGYLPFVNDLKKFSDTFINEGEKLYKLTVNNDKWLKRKWVEEQVESVTQVSSGTGSMVSPWGFTLDACCTPDGLGRTAYWTIHKVESTLVWFEGSFKYYRPEFDITHGDYSSTFSYLSRICTLYGLRVNPSTIYKATPWSWAADWITNIGDHVDMITDWGLDGVSSKYAYVMHHRVSSLVLTQTLNFRNGQRTLVWTRNLVSKQRDGAASPYSFTSGWESLTPRQISIAAALGITRAKW